MYNKARLVLGRDIMGLFGGKDKSCNICGNSGVVKEVADGCVCKDCIKKCGEFLIPASWKAVSLSRIENAIKDKERNEQLKTVFKTTKAIGKRVIIDENNRLWSIKAYGSLFFSYDDIVDYECIKNGSNVLTMGVGRAVVGGMLFGGAGIILGGLTGAKQKEEIQEFKILIRTKVKSYPEVIIQFLPPGKMKSDSPVFKAYCEEAEDLLAELEKMSGKIERQSNSDKKFSESVPDQIMKYKELLDAGAITQEEYDFKKKELLGL